MPLVIFGVTEGARQLRFPYVIVKQHDFLVFHDFDDVLVFSRAGYGLQKFF